ncbi:MAG: hypothetical protein IT457_07590 [Planctomycetes bacterium]|nr:hypothetical protein [Planctomycetota bacterium]
MQLEPIPLVAPLAAGSVPRGSFFGVILGAALLGAIVGFFATGSDPGAEPGVVASPEPSPEELADWATAMRDAPLAELAAEAERFLLAVESLGDASLLSGVERLALAVVDEDPELSEPRVALARLILDRLPFLPDAPNLERLRSRLELVR